MNIHIFIDSEPISWTELGHSEVWRKLRSCSVNCMLCNRFPSLLMICTKYRRHKLELKFKSALKIIESIIWHGFFSFENCLWEHANVVKITPQNA